MGKSTFINMICADHMAAIGDAPGESMTRNVAVYDSLLGPIVDCTGYDDSDLQIHIEDLANHVAIALTDIYTTSVQFLIFDSLADGSIQLQKSILELVTAFGTSVKSSIIVITILYH